MTATCGARAGASAMLNIGDPSAPRADVMKARISAVEADCALSAATAGMASRIGTSACQLPIMMGFILAFNLDRSDFVRTGLVITLAATLLLVLFAVTYWPWMGYLTVAK